MADGDMLVFNSDHLHATPLNISDTTRVVFTGRINPKKPTFYPNTMEAEYPHWHLASNLLARRLDIVQQFQRRENLGTSESPTTSGASRRTSISSSIVG